jgi:hypothetical protein
MVNTLANADDIALAPSCTAMQELLRTLDLCIIDTDLACIA